MRPFLIPHAALYAGYFATLGIIVTFLPPYFERLGLSSQQIGVVMSFGSAMVLIAPLTWGYISDRTRRPLLILRLCIGGTIVMMLALMNVKTFALIAPTMIVYAFFSTPVAALNDAATMNAIRDGGGDYGRVRLWGSLGFVVSALSIGFWLNRNPGVDRPVFWFMASGLAIAFISACAVRSRGSVAPPARIADIATLLADRRLRILLAAGALHWLALAPYHYFFAVHVERLGLPSWVTGSGFALGAFAEVGMMGWASKRDAPPARMLTIAFAASAARWAMMSIATEPATLVAIQALHGFSFGVFYIATLRALAEYVPDRLRATGQGLFFALVFGVGGTSGSVISGALYDHIGGDTLFGAAALVNVASIIAVRFVR